MLWNVAISGEMTWLSAPEVARLRGLSATRLVDRAEARLRRAKAGEPSKSGARELIRSMGDWKAARSQRKPSSRPAYQKGGRNQPPGVLKPSISQMS